MGAVPAPFFFEIEGDPSPRLRGSTPTKVVGSSSEKGLGTRAKRGFAALRACGELFGIRHMLGSLGLALAPAAAD